MINRNYKFVRDAESINSLCASLIRKYFATGDEYEFLTMKNYTEEELDGFVRDYLQPRMVNEIIILPFRSEEEKEAWSAEKKRQTEYIVTNVQRDFVRTAPLEGPLFVNTLLPFRPVVSSYPVPTGGIRLANGLEVVFHRKPNVRLVNMNLRCKNIRTMFCDWKEKLLFKMMIKLLPYRNEAYGAWGNFNFFRAHGVSFDFLDSDIRLSMITSEYKTVLRRLINIVDSAIYQRDDFERIKRGAVHRLTRLKEDLYYQAKHLANSMLLRDNPHFGSIDEKISFIRQVTIDDIEKSYKKFITPSNMILTIVGDFESREIQSLLREITRSWRGQPFKRPVHAVVPSAFIPGERKDHFMRRDQAIIRLVRPLFMPLFRADYSLRDALNYVCFDMPESRLFLLRDQGGLFYRASGSWASKRKMLGDRRIDWIEASVRPDRIDEAERLLKHLLDEVGEHGITEEELALFKKCLLEGGTRYDTVEALSSYYRKNIKHSSAGMRPIETISLEEVNAFARRYCNAQNFACVRVGPIARSNPEDGDEEMADDDEEGETGQ